MDTLSTVPVELVAETEEPLTYGAVTASREDLLAVEFVAQTVAVTAGGEANVALVEVLADKLVAATVTAMTGNEATATPEELVAVELVEAGGSLLIDTSSALSATRMSDVSLGLTLILLGFLGPISDSAQASRLS